MAEGRERGSPDQAVVGCFPINVAWNLRFTNLFILASPAIHRAEESVSEQSSCQQWGRVSRMPVWASSSGRSKGQLTRTGSFAAAGQALLSPCSQLISSSA